MKEVLEFISSNWSQMTLVLLGLGYLIRLYLNYLTKKREINHSLFQKMMVDSVSDFLMSYSINEELWRDLPILRIINNEFTSKEMDDMIFPSLNDIKGKSIRLNLFFDKEEMKLFEDVVSNLFKINLKVGQIHRYDQLLEKKSNSDLSWDYELTKNNINKQNQVLVDQIGKLIRKKFK